jgi:hypothetical protein
MTAARDAYRALGGVDAEWTSSASREVSVMLAPEQ